MPALRRFCLALALLWFWTSGPAHALPIQNAFGLAAPDTVLGFDEWGADGVAIETQYAAQGVVFSKPLYTLYSDNFAGMTGHALNESGTFEIQFAGVVTEAAFGFMTNPGTSTFRALLGGALVDEFSAGTTLSFNGSGTPTFFGFEGVAFDAIEVVPGGTNGAFRLDTLQFGAVATPVPEPGSFGLVAMGLAGIGLGRKRG